MRTLHLVCSAVLLAAPVAARAQGPLPLKHAPQPTAAAITAGDLMTRLYILADDSMQGRRAGEAGNLKGTAYIEREVRRLGLLPAGDGGTYFQAVPLVRRTVAARSSLAVDGRNLELWTDFTPLATRGTARRLDGAQVVYGGDAANPGIDANKLKIGQVINLPAK